MASFRSSDRYNVEWSRFESTLRPENLDYTVEYPWESQAIVLFYSDPDHRPGKTSLVRRLCGMNFQEDEKPTFLMRIDPHKKKLKADEKEKYVEYSSIQNEDVVTHYGHVSNVLNMEIFLHELKVEEKVVFVDQNQALVLCSAMMIKRLGKDSPLQLIDSYLLQMICTGSFGISAASKQDYISVLKSQNKFFGDVNKPNTSPLHMRLRDTTDYLYCSSYGGRSVRRGEFSRFNRFRCPACMIIILVFDVSDPESLQKSITLFYNNLMNDPETLQSLVLCGNKMDLCSAEAKKHCERVIERAKLVAQLWNVPIVFTSAKDTSDNGKFQIKKLLVESLAEVLENKTTIRNLKNVKEIIQLTEEDQKWLEKTMNRNEGKVKDKKETNKHSKNHCKQS